MDIWLFRKEVIFSGLISVLFHEYTSYLIMFESVV
jgi:hypothetical protein